MNLHQVIYTTPDGETKRQFAGSNEAASKLSTALRAEGKATKKPERSPVEVPTSKDDLIEWLNKNASAVAE